VKTGWRKTVHHLQNSLSIKVEGVKKLCNKR
jgi:hypothetical protein